MKVVVSSDLYAQIKPKKIYELREISQSPNRHSFYNFGSNTSNLFNFDLELKESVMYAAHYLRFTNLEVFNILDKAIKIVENTDKYIEYVLDETFGEKKFYLTPPGTVRFYSQDLICFFNGKNWRKLKPKSD